MKNIYDTDKYININFICLQQLCIILVTLIYYTKSTGNTIECQPQPPIKFISFVHFPASHNSSDLGSGLYYAH